MNIENYNWMTNIIRVAKCYLYSVERKLKFYSSFVKLLSRQLFTSMNANVYFCHDQDHKKVNDICEREL